MGLVGQGESLHLRKAGTDTRRWPCQSWGDIPTGRLARHHTQLAGAGGVSGRCLLPHDTVLVPAISPGTGPCPAQWRVLERRGGGSHSTWYRQQREGEHVGV